MVLVGARALLVLHAQAVACRRKRQQGWLRQRALFSRRRKEPCEARTGPALVVRECHVRFGCPRSLCANPAPSENHRRTSTDNGTSVLAESKDSSPISASRCSLD